MIRILRICISLFIFLSATGFAGGQITLNNSNFPVAGLNLGRGYGYSLTNVLGSAGGNQFYDFTNISPLYHDSVIYYNAAATPWAGFHPGTSVCDVQLINGINYVYYYTATASAFVRTGLTVIGDFSQGLDTAHGNYTITDTLLSDSYTYNHAENEYSCVTVNNVVPFGNYKIHTLRTVLVDGWGSLETPLNYYPDVLRAKYWECHFDTLFYFGSPIYTTSDTTCYFKFYAGNSRYPVVTAYTDAAYNLLYFEYIFTPPVIVGCTDPMAMNYNPLANQSDGSCEYCNISYTITPDTTICPGSSVTLNASGGSSYLWSDGTTSSSVVVNPAHTTVYSVYISTGPDCHALASVKVTVDEPVTVSFWTTHQTYGTGNEVQFVNLSQNATWFNWDFDDAVNGTSTMEFPQHIYDSIGTKIVVLNAGNSCYNDTFTDTLIIISSAFIETAEASESFRIFPNPATDKLFIEGLTDQQMVLEVVAFDMTGRSIPLGKGNIGPASSLLTIDVHTLPPGFYLLDIRSDEGSVKIKWIKL
jgi:hypothetical protein